jgi:hypothetical protein
MSSLLFVASAGRFTGYDPMGLASATESYAASALYTTLANLAGAVS